MIPLARTCLCPTSSDGGEALTITLTKGYSATIDAIDAPAVESYSWHAHLVGGNVYAASSSRGRFLYLHRVIVGALPGQEVDHWDRSGLNNRRCNLRIATRSQNNANRLKRGWRRATPPSSAYKGVSWHACGQWAAYIKQAGRTRYLGLFGLDEEAAARAYDATAVQIYGEFARVNFSVVR